MATTKQEYYRRLMKEKKSKSSTVQRISHPLARYNQLDQLSCVVCSTVIKSDLLWQTHLQSKQHKQKVTELKSIKNRIPPQSTKSSLNSSSLKNPQNTSTIPSPSQDTKPTNSIQIHPASKRQYTDEVPEEDLPKKKLKESNSSVMKPKELPNDFFDNIEMEVEDHTSSAIPQSTNSDLPADFFDPPKQDTSIIDSGSDLQQKESDSKKSNENQNSDIPEGFFDDPKKDAKKRKVEYKDPQDTAWEDFQKTISKETEVSESIVEKGDEMMQDDRELFEVNEQVACFQKAEELRLKQEQIRNASIIKKEHAVEIDYRNIKMEEKDDSDSDDDLNLDELSDWRFRTT